MPCGKEPSVLLLIKHFFLKKSEHTSKHTGGYAIIHESNALWLNVS